MKKGLIIFSVLLGLISCNKSVKYEKMEFSNYDDFVSYRMNRMEKPIVLLNKQGYTPFENDTVYSIVVKDSKGNIEYFDYHSELVNILADLYEKGDTIK